MCLYENKIKNIKYQPNKKNGGIPPKLEDKRLEKITTNCGWCKECRTKIANDWKIRLGEEIRHDKTAQFVTLTFSPESINKLETEMHLKKWKGLDNEDGELLTDVNLLAAYAVRMWTERWRKKHKKAPKHWLITELGHVNSERIHLHGLIFGNPKEIENTWKYGNVVLGQWVDERTINYIMKYVTKLDKDHQGYKQRIITSKGIGKCYIDEHKDYHKYNGENTRKKYKCKNGRELTLPRYYKEKLWSEEEREQLWKIELDKKEIYVGGEKLEKDKIEFNEFKKKLDEARHHNEITGYGNAETVNNTYVITDLMRVKKEEIKDFRKYKLVKCIQKRTISSITPPEENEEISKSNGIKRINYGEYQGTTTEAQRNYNELIKEADKLKVSVRTLRLIKDGIISVNNFVDKKL